MPGGIGSRNGKSPVKILVTGICGFVGSVIAMTLRQRNDISICGLDNLSRQGSETNRLKLKGAGIKVMHGDIRLESDFEALPDVDWVIDAAANPSVMAGIDGRTSSRQLIQHNLQGTINILEYCRSRKAGLILLSTSRVYSIVELHSIPLKVNGAAFEFDETVSCPPGVTRAGVQEEFSKAPPLSLYGSTKLASELLALEYADAFRFPLWINRCGVLAGAGQLGTAEQGIFSYWLHAHAGRCPLRFVGYEGRGYQVRDAFHPEDLALLVETQMTHSGEIDERIFNVGGGCENSMSLAQLTFWCDNRFGKHVIDAELTPRQFDIPWLVMDSTRVQRKFSWAPRKNLLAILEEIAIYATENPDWLQLTGAI